MPGMDGNILLTRGVLISVMWPPKQGSHSCILSQRRQHPLDKMSEMTYYVNMNPKDKPVIWLGGEIKTPPMSKEARTKAGYLMRMLQTGEILSLPESRPMPTIGVRCHELRINDKDSTWRVIYRIEKDAILILEVFKKKTVKTPKSVIELCQRRAKSFEDIS